MKKILERTCIEVGNTQEEAKTEIFPKEGKTQFSQGVT